MHFVKKAGLEAQLEAKFSSEFSMLITMRKFDLNQASKFKPGKSIHRLIHSPDSRAEDIVERLPVVLSSSLIRVREGMVDFLLREEARYFAARDERV